MQYRGTGDHAPLDAANNEAMCTLAREAAREALSREWHGRPAQNIVHGGINFRAYVLSPKADVPVTVVLVCEDDQTLRVIPPRYRLTQREGEVARLLAKRCSNKEIAKALGVSPNTAWRHTDSVLAKLGVSTRRHVLDMLRQYPANAK